MIMTNRYPFNGVIRLLVKVLIFFGILACAWTFILRPSAPLPLFGDVSSKAIDSLLNVSNVKENIDAALRSHTTWISSQTGYSESDITLAIDELNIPSWHVAPLPEDAVEISNYNANYQDIDVTITTYADPNYISVEAYGQELTLEVPPTAQAYYSLLGYLR